MRLFLSCFAISLIVVSAACGEPLSDQPAAIKQGSTVGKEPAADVQSAANEFISLLAQEKFDAAAKRFDDTMRKAVPTAQLKGVWQTTVQGNGKFQQAEPGRVNRVDKWDVVDTPCVFEKANAVIRISFDKNRQVNGQFILPSTKPVAPRKDGSEVQLKTATGTLYGTFDLPAGKGPWPVVLVVAGSGPTDRDGNQPLMKNDSLRLVGKALAAHGVAALRYDKRGIGKSAAAGAVEENLRFENYVDDAAGWIKQLRGDNRFNKVMILGHSEGSLIGMLVTKQERIDGLVSIAGSGRDLTQRCFAINCERNLPPKLFDESAHIIDELRAGRKVDNVPAELATLFRPSVQPYLMTWLKYDPAKEIADLTIPILVVQGTTDLQVSIEDAKLLASNNKNAKLVTIENMNHVLKSAPTKSLSAQTAAYSDPSLPLAPHLMDEILTFLKANLTNQQTGADSR